MSNSSETKSDGPETAAANPSDDRSSEATSKKTLSDIEESENASGSANDDDASALAPDGAFDESADQPLIGPM